MKLQPQAGKYERSPRGRGRIIEFSRTGSAQNTSDFAFAISPEWVKLSEAAFATFTGVAARPAHTEQKPWHTVALSGLGWERNKQFLFWYPMEELLNLRSVMLRLGDFSVTQHLSLRCKLASMSDLRGTADTS